MISHVYKPKRKKNGKVVIARNYRGRYRLDGDFSVTDVALKTTDKHVAEQKLRDIIKEKEHERAGIIAPKLQRNAAETPLTEHLKDFLGDLKAKGRTEDYVGLIKGRVERQLEGCCWKFTRDVSADSFISWRARQNYAPKTLNEYLNASNVLLNWMVKQGRIAYNPLHAVERVSIRGKQQLRRAYTDDELNKLLAVAEDYEMLYMSAAYTGLRLGELTALLWVDAHLDEARPYLEVRASTTKNGKPAIVPLHPCLINEFKAARAIKTGDFVFPQYAHPNRRLAKHLQKAGLERIDAAGRKLDFHSFRYTFATKLARQGVSQRLAQELMRQIEIKTLKINTFRVSFYPVTSASLRRDMPI